MERKKEEKNTLKVFKKVLIFCGCLLSLIAIVLIFTIYHIVDKSIESPAGYEKVYILEKGGRASCSGFVKKEEIESLEIKSCDVKVYDKNNLAVYTYFTKDDLTKVYVTIGGHANFCKCKYCK